MLRDCARRCVRYQIGDIVGLALYTEPHLLVSLGPQLYVYLGGRVHAIPPSLYDHHMAAQRA